MQPKNINEEDWKDEAPLLASLDRNMPDDAPEGYFEGLPASVLARIRNLPVQEVAPVAPPMSESQPPRPMRRSVFQRPVFWSVAAGIALLVTVGTYFLTRPVQGIDETLAWEQIDAETMVQLASLDRQDIAPHLDAAQVTDEQLFQALGSDAPTAFEHQDHAVEHDEAMEYLQGIDLDDIDLQDLDIDLSNI